MKGFYLNDLREDILKLDRITFEAKNGMGYRVGLPAKRYLSEGTGVIARYDDGGGFMLSEEECASCINHTHKERVYNGKFR